MNLQYLRNLVNNIIEAVEKTNGDPIITTPKSNLSSFDYNGVNSRGQQVQGVLQAVDEADATSQVKAMGMFPTRIRKSNPAQF